MPAHGMGLSRDGSDPWWVRAVDRLGIGTFLAVLLLMGAYRLGGRFLDTWATQNDMIVNALQRQASAIEKLSTNVHDLLAERADRRAAAP